MRSKRVISKGDKFGRWTVVGRGKYLGRHIGWLCRCDCGRRNIVRSSSLRSGGSLSCGCLARERTVKIKTIHGRLPRDLYDRWIGMKSRCYSDTYPCPHRYKDRGITVCKTWKNSFETFRDWAIGAGYRKHLILDRRDNDKGYSPSNCRWVTPETSNTNRNTTVKIRFKNKIWALPDLARAFRLPLKILRWRLKNNWALRRALQTPVRPRRKSE